MTLRTSLAALFMLPLLWSAVAPAAEVVENYPNGKLHLRYTADKDGHKTGDYFEFYDTGKPKIRARYKADKLDGPYTANWESGSPRIKANYLDGMRNGPYQELDEKGRLVKDEIFWQDKVLYPRSARMIQTALDAIQSAPVAVPATGKDPLPEALSDTKNVAALRRLRSYRYLAGVPDDVTLSATMCDLAKAAADICARIGHLDHRPPNPGMPADQYQKALEGTTNANLEMGRGTRACVDEFMDDSDPRNIAAVGHRRWCLNPAMLQAGFGESGKFSAMISHDISRKDVPDYDYVAFPPPGYMPVSYFSSNHAWNVSLNPAKFAAPDKSVVKVAVYPLDPGTPTANPKRRGPAVEIENFNVELTPYGIANSIIWRPKGASITAGSRYWVEITGLKKIDGTPATIEYLVEFIQL